MSSIYALLIGINQYHQDTSINPLSGAVIQMEDEHFDQEWYARRMTI